MSAIFYQIFIFQQLIPFKYYEKCFLIDQKSPFSSRHIQIFLISYSPLSLTVSHCFRAWSKEHLKVYDVLNCLNKNLKTHFLWYLEKEIVFHRIFYFSIRHWSTHFFPIHLFSAPWKNHKIVKFSDSKNSVHWERMS